MKVPSRVGNAVVPAAWPQAPVENVPIPLLSRPPTIRPNVAATMIPPRKSKRVRLRIRPTPDPDEDERPERPQPADLVVAQVARANGQRHRAGQDQEDAPAEKAPPDVHGRTVPDAASPPTVPNVTDSP